MNHIRIWGARPWVVVCALANLHGGIVWGEVEACYRWRKQHYCGKRCKGFWHRCVYIIGGFVARCCLFVGSILGKIGGPYDVMCGINFPPIDTPSRELSIATTSGCRVFFSGIFKVRISWGNYQWMHSTMAFGSKQHNVRYAVLKATWL